MNVKLLTKHHLKFLSLKGGCTGSSECTLVEIPHSWKSYVAAHMILNIELLVKVSRMHLKVILAGMFVLSCMINELVPESQANPLVLELI